MYFFQTMSTVRVLLLTSQELHVFSWKKGVLCPVGMFTADDRGLAEFNRYLSTALDVPVYLVADLIEEDFRVEPVAHVRGNDRKALLERKLFQFFRTSEYRSARIQDREEKGRRDDRVLFSALTNSDQFAMWIDCLLEKKIRLKGILSVPLLMELFAEFRHLEQIPHLLLVNLEQRSGLRQTYLQGKRLKFSRLLSLTTIRAGSPAEVILAECSHTRQYLERLKLLPHDQPLEIHVHVDNGTKEEIGRNLADSALLHFHVHESGMAAAEMGIDPALTDGQGTVFLCLMRALQTGRLFNAYGPPPVLRYHRLHRIRRGLIAGTSLIAAVALLAGAALLIDGFTKRSAQNILEREARMFEHQYRELSNNFPETPLPAGVMQNVVDSVELIRQQAVSPVQMMALISRAVTLSPGIRLQQFDWQLLATAGTVDTTQPETDGRGDMKIDVPPLVPGLLAGKAGVTTTLNGIVYPNGGYWDAQRSVTGFIAALERIPGLKVVPITLPTPTNPDATVKATLDGGDILAEFSLQLAYRPMP